MTQQANPEGIRAWYSRTTSAARKALLLFSVVGAIGACIVFAIAPATVMERIQQFNGALTIPLFGLIWIVGFIYMFLIPQREAGFRSQEWVETMVTTFKSSMDTQISPAVKTWTEVGEKVRVELPTLLEDIKTSIHKASETMDDLRVAAKRIVDAVEKNEKALEDAKPAIEALKRIEQKVEVQIKGGFFENVQSALESVRVLGGMPPTTKDMDEPDPTWALKSIRENKAKTGVKA